MSRRLRATAFAVSCVAAGLLPVSAEAAIMNFTYETVFQAKVDPVVVFDGIRKPFVDKDAQFGRLNNLFGLSVFGSFDTDDIKKSGGVESVLAKYTMKSDIFGTVFQDPYLVLSKASDGNFQLYVDWQAIRYPRDRPHDSGTFLEFKPTVLSAESVGARGTATSTSLSQEGSYRLFGEKYENIYGTQLETDVEGRPNYGQYFSYGADVAKGFTQSAVAGFGSLTFTLADPISVDLPPSPGGGGPIPTPAVPEPASWALLIGGIGFAGGVMRSRRQTVRVAYA